MSYHFSCRSFQVHTGVYAAAAFILDEISTKGDFILDLCPKKLDLFHGVSATEAWSVSRDTFPQRDSVPSPPSTCWRQGRAALSFTDASFSSAHFTLIPSDALSPLSFANTYFCEFFASIYEVLNLMHMYFLELLFSSEILCSCSAIERQSYDCHFPQSRLASFFFFFSFSGRAKQRNLLPSSYRSVHSPNWFFSFSFFPHLKVFGKV